MFDPKILIDPPGHGHKGGQYFYKCCSYVLLFEKQVKTGPGGSLNLLHLQRNLSREIPLPKKHLITRCHLKGSFIAAHSQKLSFPN